MCEERFILELWVSRLLYVVVEVVCCYCLGGSTRID
jgi:hypothetical protein